MAITNFFVINFYTGSSKLKNKSEIFKFARVAFRNRMQKLIPRI